LPPHSGALSPTVTRVTAYSPAGKGVTSAPAARAQRRAVRGVDHPPWRGPPDGRCGSPSRRPDVPVPVRQHIRGVRGRSGRSRRP
jgi:hypothetical protein